MNRIKPRRGLALLLLVLSVAACSESGVTEPLRPSFAGRGNGPDLEAIATYRNGPPSFTIAWSMAWIGPEGGSVRMLDFEVVIPPGALERRTRIAIRLPVDPKHSTHAYAEFEPHGLQFRKPVTLRVPYSGTTADQLPASVLWWSGSAWESYSSTVLPDGRLETTTSHFSTYGTEAPTRGITPLGG